MKTENNQATKRRRKMLVILPFLAWPFITLFFWALGGGNKAEAAGIITVKKGMNTTLPVATNDKLMDKMAYYKQAAQDSSRKEGMTQSQEYFNRNLDVNAQSGIQSGSMGGSSLGHPNTPTLGLHSYADPNETKIYDKLNTLNATLNQPVERQQFSPNPYNQNPGTSVNTADIDRLEAMMKSMQAGGGDKDPEMAQVNGMLEKIFDIQHPDAAQEKIRQLSKSHKGQVFSVAANKNSDPISLLNNEPPNNRKDSGIDKTNPNGFFSIDDAEQFNDAQNSIPAVVHQTQTLVEGSTVKLRLTSDVMINGVLIPKDNFLFGTAALNGERLTIRIESVRFKTSLFPVQLQAYDMDGMDGIYIPDAISRNVAKESADRAMQGLGFTSMDPSIGAQAASAGIEAAKSLIGKKVKLIKVTVKAGYQVLLRDEKDK